MEIKENIKAVSGYIIRPTWKDKTSAGVLLDIGYKFNDQMPAWYWATEGTVVASQPEWEAQPGDTVYFTWNALSFDNGCISHPREENLFCLRHSYYALKRDGVLYAMSEKDRTPMSVDAEFYTFVLLEVVEQKEEEKITESGIVLSGFAIKGAGINDAEVIQKATKKKLHGKISVLPINLPYDSIYDPFTGEQNQIEVGLNVVCENTSDVQVKIDNKIYYRTRFSEIIYSYHD